MTKIGNDKDNLKHEVEVQEINVSNIYYSHIRTKGE